MIEIGPNLTDAIKWISVSIVLAILCWSFYK